MTTTVSNVIDRTLKKKNTIKESKYSVKELSRPTETLRAHSEVIENVHVNYSRKHDEDKETYSYMADQSEDSSQTEQQLKIRKKIQPESTPLLTQTRYQTCPWNSWNTRNKPWLSSEMSRRSSISSTLGTSTRTSCLPLPSRYPPMRGSLGQSRRRTGDSSILINTSSATLISGFII